MEETPGAYGDMQPSTTVEKNFETTGENIGRAKNTAFIADKADQQNTRRKELIEKEGFTPTEADEWLNVKMDELISEGLQDEASKHLSRSAIKNHKNPEVSNSEFELAKEAADKTEAEFDDLMLKANAAAANREKAKYEKELAEARARLAELEEE